MLVPAGAPPSRVPLALALPLFLLFLLLLLLLLLTALLLMVLLLMAVSSKRMPAPGTRKQRVGDSRLYRPRRWRARQRAGSRTRTGRALPA